MKFSLKIFQSKKAEEVNTKKKSIAGQNDASSITMSADASQCSTIISGKTHGKKNGGHKKSKQQTPIPNIVEEYQTPNEKIVAAYIDMLNLKRNTITANDILAFYASESVPFKFEDVPNLPSRVYADEMMRVYQSFPDFHLDHGAIKESKPGCVVVEDMIGSGNHTGAPYSFAHFPPVETTHKHCVNDPERFCFTIKDGKITHVEVISLGDLTGCPGFYLQIGGSLDSPPQDSWVLF